MAEFSLPPGHPFTNVRPGYTGYESAPSPAIVSATASYVGAVGDYANNTITFRGYSTTPGDWTVTTPSGLTILVNPNPNNDSSTTIVYTGGRRNLSYTFYSILQLPTIGTLGNISWGGVPPSVTLTVPDLGTTIETAYYDGSRIYLNPATVTALTPLIEGITGYFFRCTNNASYASVDSTDTAQIFYPSGNVFTPGTSTILNFTVACRFLGILGEPSTPDFPVTIIQPAVPTINVTSANSTSTSINISWAVSTPNCTFTISTGGTILVPTTNPFTVIRSPGSYSFQVGATLCGLTTYSAIASTAVAPLAPTSFTGIDNLNNSVTLTWAGQTAGSIMNLTWTGTAAGSATNIGNSPYNLSLPCGTYAFNLVSVCGGITSGSFGINSIHVTPPTPTNFQQSVFGSTATLSWSSATPGAAFTLTSSPPVGVTPNISGNTAVYSGVAAGTYTITLRSVSGGLESVGSISTAFVVSLAAPTNFSARSLGSRITLNWAGSTLGASFSVSSTNNSAFGTQTIPVGIFTTSYGNVSTPGIYTFSIVSVLPGNNASAPVTTTGQIVSTPADFRARSTGSTINLSWTQATTGSTFSLASSPTIPNLSINGTTATATNVPVGNYTFNLSAFTSGGSFLSTIISTATQVVPTPTTFSAAFVAPDVRLTWASAVPGYIFTVLSSPSLTNPGPTTSLTAQYSSPLPGNYTFSVTAADGSGNTSFPAFTSQTVTPPAPSNLAYTAVSPTAFTITFSQALANCSFGFTDAPTVGSVVVTEAPVGSFRAAFTGVTPPGTKDFRIVVNSSFGGILSTGNPSITARTKPNTSFSSNALCTVVAGQNTVSARYIINNPDGVGLYGPDMVVGTSYTVNMLYSGTTIPPGVSASSPGKAGVYYTNWWDAGGYSITVPSQFPDFIVPPTIGTVTVSGTTITVPWTDSPTGSYTYSIVGTLSASGIPSGTGTRIFTNGVVGTSYSFTLSLTSGYVTANSATSTAVTPISAPTNLTASAVGTTVNMSWSYGSPLNGITFNVLDQNGTARGNTGLTTTTTSFTVSDSTAYTFRVQAIAPGGNVRATSDGISVTTVPVPSIATILHNGSVITISCGIPTSGILSIVLSSGTALTVGSTTNPFTYNEASPNTAYGFTVINTGTRSTNTAPSTITTLGRPTFTKSDASGTSVILQWSYPTGAPAVTSYSVFLSGNTTAVATGLTSSSYTFIPSSGSAPFVYTVVALGSPGTSIASAPTDNITPLTAVTLVGAGATSTNGTEVTVRWTYPTGGNANVTFKIYDPTLTTEYSTYSYSSVSPNYSNTFSTGLTANSTYSFVVVTTNAQGDTAVSGITSNVTLLTAPIVNSVNQSGNQIFVTLSAQPVITPAPYTPYYTIPSIIPASLTLTASLLGFFTFSGATSATAYTFTFQNNAGVGVPNSTNTTSRVFTTLSTPVPGSIAYIPTTSTISASWTYIGTLAGTQFILRNQDGSQFGTVTGVTSANISATIGTTYTLTVTASSGGNVSLPSTTFASVTASLPINISSFVQNGTRLIATISGSATSASTVPSLGFPSAFPGNPTLWLDAADPNATGIPAANGDPIATWKDKSGLGCNATATGTPTIISSGLNGRPTMNFNGSSWFTGLTANTGTTTTIFMVMQQPAQTSSINPAYTRVLSMGPLGGSDDNNGGVYTKGLLIEFVGGNILAWRADATYSTQPVNTPYIFDYQINGTNAFSFLNGADQGSFASTNTFTIGRYRIGGIVQYDGTPQYTGYVSEVIIFRESLTTDQRKTIEYYLAQKWGFANVPSGFTGSPLTFTFNGASANTNYVLTVNGVGSTASSAVTTLYTPTIPTLTAPDGTGVYASSTYNGSTNPPGVTINYYNISGNTLLTSSPTNSFVATASQSYTLYASATSGLNTSISSGNSLPIIPIGPIILSQATTAGGGVAITCSAAGATSFSGSSPGLSASVVGNVITFANLPNPSIYYTITITATNVTGATNSTTTTTQRTTFAPASIPGLSMWYDAADTTSIGFRPDAASTFTNLQFWLDFADGTNLTALGGNLTQIKDKSGNNYTATAGTTVDYNATTKLLHIHNGQYLNIPQASINAAPLWSMFLVIQPVNLTRSFIIAKQIDNINSPTIFGIGSYSAGNGGPAYTTPGTFTFKSTNNNGTPDHASAAVLTTSLQLLSMTYDAERNFKFYVNGTLCNTIQGSWTIVNETNANNFMLGSWYANGSFYGNGTDFYLGELRFHNTNLGDFSRQLAEGVLAWKWGLQTSLPSAHPYSTSKISTAPASTAAGFTNEVVTWRDKSGNGRDAKVSSGSIVYPIYSPAIFNGGYPGVRFSGNVNALLRTETFPLSPTLSSNGNDFTMFVVYNMSSYFFTSSPQYDYSPIEGGPYAVVGTSTYTNFSLLQAPYDFGRIGLRWHNYDPGARTIWEQQYWPTYHRFAFNSTIALGPTNVLPPYAVPGEYRSPSPGGPILYTVRKYGSNLEWFNNGSTLFSGPTTAAKFAATTNDSFVIGGVGPSVFDSHISEIMIYNYSLNTAQRQQIEGYLAWKWGLQNALSPNNPYNGPGGQKPPSYIGPLTSGPIEWIDGADEKAMNFSLPPAVLRIPQSIPALSMWFDADDFSQITLQPGTTNVSGWKDKSGNGWNTRIVGGGALPTYSQNGFNNDYPGILFNNGAFLETISSVPASVLSSNTRDNTVFLVFNNTDSGCNVVFSWEQFNYSFLNPYYAPNVSPGLFQFNDPNAQYIFLTPNPIKTPGPQIYSIVKTSVGGPSTTLYNFGESKVVSGVNPLITGGDAKFYVGGGTGYGTTVAFQSYISELIIYNYALTPTQRQQVEGYLAWKWGLQAQLQPSHPASVAPPSPYSGPLTSGAIMWYDASDSSTMTFTMTDVTGFSFLPSTLPQLAMWFDAYDYNTIEASRTLNASGGYNISEWKDKSGNGWNTTATTGTAAFYSSNNFIINGRNYPSITFTGGSILQTANLNPTPVLSSNSTDTTMFIVMNSQNENTNRCVFSCDTDVVYQMLAPWFEAGFTQTRYFRFGGANNIRTNFTETNNVAQLYCIVKLGNTVTWYNFGIAVDSASGTAGTTLPTTSQRFNIGGRLANSGNNYSQIGELIIYNYALNSIQRQQVEGYLAWTWGLYPQLQPNHLCKTSPPQTYTGALSSGPIMWYDATDSSTMTFANTNISGLILPSTIPQLAMWFDAYDNSTVILSNGVTVKGWKDKSGNGWNTTVGGTGTRPAYSFNGFNGRPGILFQSGGYLSTSTLNPTPVLSSNATDTTVFMVYNSINNTDATVAFSLDNDAQYSVLSPYVANKHYFGFGGVWIFDNIDYVVTPGPQLYSITKQGINSTWYNFGSIITNGTSTTAGTITSTSQKFNIGYRPAVPTQSYNSYISEIIIYNRALNQTQRQQVEGYLAWKWGLQGRLRPDHPAVTNNPPMTFSSLFSVSPIAWYDAADATTLQLGAISLPSPQLWLDGADSASVIKSESTTTVVRWNDKSGNGYNMNQLPSSGSTYPVVGSTINGSNTVFFNASAGLKTSTLLNNVKNFYWVGRIASLLTASGSDGYYFMLGGPYIDGNNQYYDWHSDPYPGGLMLNSGWANSGIRSASASLITADVNASYGTTFSALKWPTAPSVSFLSVGGITGNAQYDGICYDRIFTARGWCGDLGEVLIYSNALTLAQHQQVEGYLAWKWGVQANLPTGHPYKVRSPSWTPASFGGAGSTIEKWYDKSGNSYDLSLGGGSVTYSIPGIGPAINLSGGYMFINKPANLQNYALFTVMRSYTAVDNQSIITGRPSNVTSYDSTDGFGLYVDSSGTSELRLYGSSAGSNVNTVPGTGKTYVFTPKDYYPSFVTATPGTFTTLSDANYTYYRFTQNSTVTISSTISSAPVYYLAIGGGGGGGGGGTGAGGGGAGGLQTNIYQPGFFIAPLASQYIPSGVLTLSGGRSYTITIGTGGTSGTSGTATTFSGTGITTIRAEGGGAGAATSSSPVNGSNGGSGGGASGGFVIPNGLGGIGTQGYNGGSGLYDPGYGAGAAGGGGGLGGPGSNVVPRQPQPFWRAYGIAGDGGPPISFLNYSLGGGGGGGGAGQGNNISGIGGGGGAGDGGGLPGGSGASNTGSGGGGAGPAGQLVGGGGTGGSGVFFLMVPNSAPVDAMAPVIASYTGASNGVISSWINGSAGTVTNTGANRTTTGQGFAIGAEWIGSSYTNFASSVTNIYEIVVMSNIPTTLQRQQMEGYLAWKWKLQGNLPMSHPYKTSTSFVPIPPSPTTNIINVSDKSGYNNTLTSNSTLYPTYVSSAKGIYFGPNTALSNNFAKVPAGYTVIAVASLSSIPTGYGRLVSVGLSDFIGYLGVDSNSSNFMTLAGNGGTQWATGSVGTANSPATGVATYPTMSILEMNVCGSTLTPYFNGSGMTVRAGTTIATEGIQLGGFSNIQNWTGYLHEFLMVSERLSSLQRQQLEGYLAWKWNLSSQLPAGHLFKNASPIQATLSSQIQPSVKTTNIATISDKSGYGNTLVPSSFTYTTYDPAVKGIYFGPGAGLRNPSVTILAGYSMFAIASLTSTPTDYGRLVNIGTTDFNGFMGTYSNSSNYQTFIGNGASWNAPFPSAPSPAAPLAIYPQVTMLELTFSAGTTYTPYINASNLSGISSAGQSSTVTGINFGQLPPGTTQPWTGNLHEFILVSKVLTSGQRQQIEGYLAWKWNISSQLPANHPYRSGSPVEGRQQSNVVRGFFDKSEFGNNFSVLPTSINYPQYSALYKGVYIGNSASFLNSTLSIPPGYTMMAVASLSTTPATYGRLINVGQGDAVGFMGTFNATTNFATFTGNGSGWNDTNANTPATPVSTNPLVPSILEMTVCGSVLNPFFNASGMTAKTGTTISATGMIIGATANNGGQFWTGYLNEFILVPRNITSLQRQQMEGYLAWKWGLQGSLPSTHPFKNARP